MDRLEEVDEHWNATVIARAQRWRAWALRRGITMIRVHVGLCSGRIEGPTGRWRCRLCSERVAPDQTKPATVHKA
jgi:hypothetical protein